MTFPTPIGIPPRSRLLICPTCGEDFRDVLQADQHAFLANCERRVRRVPEMPRVVPFYHLGLENYLNMDLDLRTRINEWVVRQGADKRVTDIAMLAGEFWLAPGSCRLLTYTGLRDLDQRIWIKATELFPAELVVHMKLIKSCETGWAPELRS